MGKTTGRKKKHLVKQGGMDSNNNKAKKKKKKAKPIKHTIPSSQNSKSKVTSNKNKNKKKKKIQKVDRSFLNAFQTASKMSVKYSQCPWNGNKYAEKSFKSLWGDEMADESSIQLSNELCCFANYTRLQNDEVLARRAVIQEVVNATQSAFGRKTELASNENGGGDLENEYTSKSSSSGKEDVDDPIRVVCYGSFAAQLVSTFYSDVDLCIWGLIPTSKENFNPSEEEPEEGDFEETVESVDGDKTQESDDSISVISIHSSSSDTDDASASTTTPDQSTEDEPEISIVNKPSLLLPKLSNRERSKINQTLNKISQRVWKSKLFKSNVVLRHARVPILQGRTRYNFECDVSIGGHNGSDTSIYAGACIEKYKSFAPVVVFLKVLLQQADLDKAFTGGIGSFKLYVLVCHHLEVHVDKLKGVDLPSSVLMTFLYRYSQPKSRRNCPYTTVLNKESVITSHNGEYNADMRGVFKIENIKELFLHVFNKLSSSTEKKNQASVLGSILHIEKLRGERDEALRFCKLASAYAKGYISVEQKSCVSSSNENTTRKRKEYSSINEAFNSDEEAEMIMKGYGVKKNKRGEIINLDDNSRKRQKGNHRTTKRNDTIYGCIHCGVQPLTFPKLKTHLVTVHHINTKKLKGFPSNYVFDPSLLGRGSKNRKSKKKQNRDAALTAFSRSQRA